MAGMMGNVQTPLLQFPHVYFFTSTMLDSEYRKRSEKEVLLDLAGHLYPEHRQLAGRLLFGNEGIGPGENRCAGRIGLIGILIQHNKLGTLGHLRPQVVSRPPHRGAKPGPPVKASLDAAKTSDGRHANYFPGGL